MSQSKKGSHTHAAGAPEGTAVLSTGETGGTKFLREDGDGTCSWVVPSGSGDVSKVGTPVDNQVGVWTGDGTIEGTSNLVFDSTGLGVDMTPSQKLSINTASGAGYLGFYVSGTGKSYIGCSTAADNPIAGMASGDLGIRVNGGALFLSTDSGVTANVVLTSSGDVEIAGDASVGAGKVFTTTSGNDLNLVYPDTRSLFIKEGSTTHVTVDNVGDVKIEQGLGLGGVSPASGSILVIPAADTTTKPQIRFASGDGSGLADAAISTTDDSGGTNVMIGANQYWSAGAITRFTTGRSGSAVDFGYSGHIKFYTGSGTAAPTEAMRITAAGLVGIGVTPYDLLEVSGAGRSLGTGTNYNVAKFESTTADKGGIMLGGTSYGVNDSGVIFPTTSTGSLNLNVGSGGDTQGITITSGGYVGVGTASPSAGIHLAMSQTNGHYLAKFHTANTSQPYGVNIKEPDSATAGYPLLDVTSASETFFRVDSGNGRVKVGNASHSEITELTDASTVPLDFDDANNFKLLLTSSVGATRELETPSNITAGQSGCIVITQEAVSGGNALTYTSAWHFEEGDDPDLSTSAGKVDTLAYYCPTDAIVQAVLLKDMS